MLTESGHKRCLITHFSAVNSVRMMLHKLSLPIKMFLGFYKNGYVSVKRFRLQCSSVIGLNI